MSWPQVVMLALILWGLVIGIFKSFRDKSLTSGWATFAVLVQLAMSIGVALVLYAGGFW